MKVLFVVQRYGIDVAGGAEQHCRALAEALSGLGHDVHVATTTAKNYVTWANHYVSGDEIINGVYIHRFPTTRQRDKASFDALSARLDFEGLSHSIGLEYAWISEQGPECPGLRDWLILNASEYDVAVLFTYLYATTGTAIEVLCDRIPTALHATAHREAPLNLRLIRRRLKKVRHFLCSTPEEASLLTPLSSHGTTFSTIGVPVELPRRKPALLPDVLRSQQIPTNRFALVLGRVDGSKGVLEGISHFRQFKATTASTLRLVVVGENVEQLQSDNDVTFTGYLPEQEVLALLLGAEILIQPSYFESFSLALCEAWLARLPSLSNGQCDVLAGQSYRSGGGLTYSDQQSFIDLLRQLDRDPLLRLQLGKSGRQYVMENFRPEIVTRRLEQTLLALCES